MIPFNKPYLTGKETYYIEDAVKSGKISGNGKYTQKCQTYFEQTYGFKKTLLTTSCTDALEMAAILINIKEGDEVIMPSYTFVSTANAFVLRGGVPVFVDIREDTLNLDERLIEAANIFEGKPFGIGDGVLKHPSAWRHLYNPWKPSWGEPYDEQIARMLAAIFAANKAANGKDAICVSHQLPIWILRSAIEGRRLIHDPRKRECSLASVTSVHFDDEGLISGLSYSEPAKHLLPPKK